MGIKEYLYKQLLLPSIEYHSRLILFFKIERNLLVLPSHCSLQPTLVSHTHTNNSLKFSHLQSRIDLYKYSFLPGQLLTGITWKSKVLIDTINLDTFKNIIQLS